ncbi:uncharacterized protein KIAA0930 isoform X1 [Dermacentor andersoni]|uniref:uncharacterized protein KIAA0930 isoform X1 n=1 Tax=Dermacentor andersoni TaxID=34620 RepID=UPI003B3AA2AA
MADDARDGRSSSNALSSVFAEISQLRSREATDITPSGFVVVTSASFWMDIFIRHFLCAEGVDQHDDLVFFVKKTASKAARRYVPRLETTVQVFRRNSKKLPIADLDLHWEETVYLNLIVQQLEYTLTAAACLRTGNQHLQVLRRRSQRVYASPTRHSMEDKGDTEEVAYPDIFFAVDNYEEAFQGLNLKPGELLCVELCARCRDGPQAALLFLGCVAHEPLARTLARADASSSAAPRGRCHFVGLRGPQGRGQAQVALRRAAAVPSQEWPCGPWRRSSEPGLAPPPNPGPLHRCRSERQGIDQCGTGEELEADDLRDALCGEDCAPVGSNRNEGLLDTMLTYVALPWHHIVADLLDIRREPLLTF